jgi:hypothetical protein
MHDRSLAGRWLVAVLVAVVAACARTDPDADVVRGHGLKPAGLPAAAEARIDEAAIRAAFDVEPSLVLMVHARRLPRSAGTAGGAPTPDALVRVLRERGLVTGTCDPVHDEGPRNTPRCTTSAAGYVVRPSDVLRVSADTVEVYFDAETFGPAKGRKPDALHFEKVYQLVGSGTDWRVVREGRSPAGPK